MKRKAQWTGHDTPDFEKTKRPDYAPPDGAQRENALAGWHPFIMQDDGLGWLFAPNGVVDGPLPTYFEPQESPVRNLLYGQQANPCRQEFPRPYNEYNPSPSDEHGDLFPFVLYTYRLTEHHTAGGMSRTVAHLSELQPELFCEVTPELAALRGIAARRVGRRSLRCAPSSKRAFMVTKRAPALHRRRPRRALRRLAVSLGTQRLGHRRFGKRSAAHRARPERAHPRDEGSHLRHPARAASARSGDAALPAQATGTRAASEVPS